MLKIENLTCGYERESILEDVNFTIKPGEIVSILGPNGSGKSTLIKSILGLLEPIKGDIYIEGENIKKWDWKERASKIGYIPQYFNSTFQYRAIDIVLMGRTSHLGLMAYPRKKDYKIAENAMEILNINHLKEKIYSKLSGGERQLVKIAQSIAQESKLIIMDEPTSNLDFNNQVMLLKHLKKLSLEGIGIILVTHCPEHALSHSHKVLLVKNRQVFEIDNPKNNLKEGDLKELYDIELEIVEFSKNNENIKMCIPIY